MSENEDLDGKSTLKEKCALIFQTIDVNNISFSARRLGQGVSDRISSRPILVTVEDTEVKDNILKRQKIEKC